MSKKSKTLFVNLAGGPGAGKSTIATHLFSLLKQNGVNSEYIHEYAKDKVWGEDKFTLLCQPYVYGKQFFKQFRLLDKVTVAVTDSPIFLSSIYGRKYGSFGCTETFEKCVIEQFNMFNNVNILLARDNEAHPYNPAGRGQTLEESRAIDNEVQDYMDSNSIPYYVVRVTKDDEAVKQCLKIVQSTLLTLDVEYRSGGK